LKISAKQLEKIILSEMSKANTLFARNLVLADTDLFKPLFNMVLRDEEPLSRRAIWIMDYVVEAQPDLLSKTYIIKLIDNLNNYSHEALIRHSLRIIARYKIPESHQGQLLNSCFDYLIDPKTSIASKAWSMDILYKFSEEEPDLKQELIMAIEINLEHASPGIKNKASKMLKKLKKQVYHLSLLK
jgi:predicted transcriptional regulator